MEEAGKYPFTRGIYEDMYRGRLWTMRQYAGLGSARETNKRFQYLLSQGQTGLSVAFHLPTQLGYDSDHPLAIGEIGRAGVAVDTLKDMEILFKNIPLDKDKISTSMTINATAPILLAMYIALAKKQGVPLEKLEGTIQNDILKEYIARNAYIFPPSPSIRLVGDIFEYCVRNMPKWNMISISGYHIREAGSTAVQEVAFTLANAIEYMNLAKSRGLDLTAFGQRVSFFFAGHNNFLEEIAKFRAARRLWAKIMRERFNMQDNRACQLRFHVQTCGHTLTMEQPLNNIVRTTIQALAAVLGGAQSLHTNSFDEAYATPSEEAVLVALRTQQIIAYESGIAAAVDPAGGSYYIESLTDIIESQANTYIAEIDKLGGAVSAIEQGYIQREIQNSSFFNQKEIWEGRKVVVGVNKFQSDYQGMKKITKISPKVAERQIKFLAAIRRKRNQTKVDATLKSLERVARSNDNIMPVLIECVENYATIGEICSVLRSVFGKYKR